MRGIATAMRVASNKEGEDSKEMAMVSVCVFWAIGYEGGNC